jgi:DNA-binding NarL/FixJ family response regulator
MTCQNAPIRVLTVDDHPICLEGIAALLENKPDIVLIAEATNGREAIERFREHRPDVTLMDLQMPVMNGIDAIIAIRSEFPDARIVVLTTYKGDVQATRALEAGATGYLLKSALRKELLDTIRTVHAGRRGILPEVALAMAEHHGADSLTEREIEVLRHVVEGNANKIVASQLRISEETVKGHVRSILAKLGANDRTHAVTIAIKRGIINLEE